MHLHVHVRLVAGMSTGEAGQQQLRGREQPALSKPCLAHRSTIWQRGCVSSMACLTCEPSTPCGGEEQGVAKQRGSPGPAALRGGRWRPNRGLLAAVVTLLVPLPSRSGFYFSLHAPRPGGGRGGREGRGGWQDGGDGAEDVEGPWPAASAQAGAAAEPSQQQPQQAPEAGAASGGGGRPRVPPGFSVLAGGGRSVQLTTHELNALNARLRDASNDCLVLTEQVHAAPGPRVVWAHGHCRPRSAAG